MNEFDLHHYNLRRGGARVSAKSESAFWHEMYGLHYAEFHLVLAIMAHYRLFGCPPMRVDLESMDVNTKMVQFAIRAGFIEETPLHALRPTKKAWKELGFFPAAKAEELAQGAE